MPKSKPKNPSKKRAAATVQTTSQNLVAMTSLRNRLNLPRLGRHKSAEKVQVAATLPSSLMITKKVLDLVRLHWKVLLGITLVYAVLNIILVQGLGGSGEIETLKSALEGQIGKLGTGLAGLLFLVSSSGKGSGELAGVYQTFLALIVSLALVWALREVMAGGVIRVRDAYYKGMYPLIPVILVLGVIGLQMIPFLFGAGLYSLVVGNGIANSPLEYTVWGLLFFGLTLISLYMLASSVFALYIATLPDMTPIKALKSARELVRGRRWIVLRKILYLPFALFVVAGAVLLPIILWLTPLAPWIFFVISMAGIVVVHAYMYILYRELLV